MASEAPTIETATPRIPPTLPVAAVLREAPLPTKLIKPADFERLHFTLFAARRALDSDYRDFAQAAFHERDGDAERIEATAQLEAQLDAFQQNFAPQTGGTSKFALGGKQRDVSFELLIYDVLSSCALNRNVHAMRRHAERMMTICVKDIPAAAEARLYRTATPVLRMSACDLMRHVCHFEREFRKLRYSDGIARYIDLLHLRAAMLMRGAHPYAAFDLEKYADAIEPRGCSDADRGDDDEALPAAVARLYRHSRTFLQDTGWFFLAIGARLYTAQLWPRQPRGAIDDILAAKSEGRFVLKERAERMRAFLRRISTTMSIEVINARFREFYLVHVMYLSERKRYLRAKTADTMTVMRVIKAGRGIDVVNEYLGLADTEARDALAPERTPFGDDPGAIDLMQVRVIDAYMTSFLVVRFDETYVYYANEIMESYRSMRVSRLPLVVQTFTRLELLWDNCVYECDDMAEVFSAWLAIVSLCREACEPRRPDGILYEKLYRDVWGEESALFVPVEHRARVAAWKPVIE